MNRGNLLLAEIKARMRDSARRKRNDAAKNGQIGAALAANIEAAISIPITAIMSGFWPIGSEADIMPTLAKYDSLGCALTLPIVVGRNTALVFRRWRDGDDMDKGPFGVAEPKSTAEELRPDVLLVPLLAFDRAGYRLGYGGGYYDRTLRGLRALKPIVAIGVGFAAQEMPKTPRGLDDEPVDWIVTENEAFKIITD
ncbi:MAG: 5-formyltetrahydrofolate cyclo-ligase [Alphaproteobacteria bacterium]|nr:5-formyltetrahydrofolate cyclo-ligase [Alphaproteobacteria bacterium]